jgi:AraC family transcriptional regulator, chitin signaling transcriptional activator
MKTKDIKGSQKPFRPLFSFKEKQMLPKSIPLYQKNNRKKKSQSSLHELGNKELLQNKNKELASLSSQITRKNELLETIKEKLTEMIDSIKLEEKKKVETLIRFIDKEIQSHPEWATFELYFDQANSEFLKKLKVQFPQLTPTDLKLSAYLKMNISSKEIAPLLHISVRSVEVSRYRLRRKLGLTSNVNLVDFMIQI